MYDLSSLRVKKTSRSLILISVEKCKSTLHDTTYRGITEKINMYDLQKKWIERYVDTE